MDSSNDIFDYASLAHLLQGDETLMQTILNSFRNDFTIQYQKLTTAVTEADVGAAQKLAHKIKGASANVRAIEINVITTAMDAAGKAGDLAGIEERLEALTEAFERFNDYCGQYLSD